MSQVLLKCWQMGFHELRVHIEIFTEPNHPSLEKPGKRMFLRMKQMHQNSQGFVGSAVCQEVACQDRHALHVAYIWVGDCETLHQSEERGLRLIFFIRHWGREQHMVN
jgi:hypothetical protein